ncbi:hypothetical protein ACQZV8_18915 [Magnetococcales bacterium HHB-1]
MRSFLLRFAVLCLFLSIPFQAVAESFSAEDVPSSLRPWIPWVMHHTDQQRCPVSPIAKQRICAWNAPLILSVTEKGATFQQQWRVLAEMDIILPGSRKLWPTNVQYDQKPAIIKRQGEKPALHLLPGTYNITGTLTWKEMPEYIPLARSTGYIHFSQNGKKHPTRHPDKNGRLWLQQAPVKKTVDPKETQREVNQVHLRVMRKIIDAIPMQVITRVEMQVTGRAREILLAQPYFPQMKLFSFQSPLPARVEDKGRIRLKAKPGTWTLSFTLRHNHSLTTLTLPEAAKEGVWAEEEIWVFQSQDHLRRVTPASEQMIDPHQTTLPKAWRKFPSFLMVPGRTLSLEVHQRGLAQTQPLKLDLKRTLWLDFDGQGYTFRDRLNGTGDLPQRFEVKKSLEPGRASHNGKDIYITRLQKDGAPGVELIPGHNNLIMESRINQSSRTLPANGWNLTLKSAQADLHLPVGWRLWHVSGVDEATDTWIQRWTPLDLFLVLIIALTMAKTYGLSWGIGSGLAMMLVHPEHNELAIPMILLLIALALKRVKTSGWIKKGVFVLWIISILWTLGAALPFAIHQARLGLHPQLDYAGYDTYINDSFGEGEQVEGKSFEEDAPMVTAAPNTPSMNAYQGQSADSAYDRRRPMRQFAQDVIQMKQARIYAKKKKVKQIEQKRAIPQGLAIQTGPGIPQWKGHNIRLSWNGPVTPEQSFHLYLTSPLTNQVLSFIKALLPLLLLGRLLVSKGDKGWSITGLNRQKKAVTTAVILLAMILSGGHVVAGQMKGMDMPSQDILDQLKSRLLKPAFCAPDCALLQQVHLEENKNRLTIHLVVHATEKAVFPLPGKRGQWVPDLVHKNDQALDELSRNHQGIVSTYLEKGIHHLTLSGRLPLVKDTVSIYFPLAPERLEFTGQDWKLEGVKANQAIANALQLRRDQPIKKKMIKQSAVEKARFDPVIPPPFVRVSRQLELGIIWRMTTTVRRLTPADGPWSVILPLLPGESIAHSEVQVKENQVKVNIPPFQNQMQWESELQPQDKMVLTAAKRAHRVEIWSVKAESPWHFTFSGDVPPTHPGSQPKQRITWNPWPGERLDLQITRPLPAPGATVTLDASQRTITPGHRATETELMLRLRSSRGGQHRFSLPEKAQPLSLTINGRAQPLPTDYHVVIPLSPGKTVVKISWREEQPIGFRFKPSTLKPGLASVNHRTTINVPEGRWVLWSFGPRQGPAILFWGSIPILLLGAWLLGKYAPTPLKHYEWFLLGLGIFISLDVSASIVIPIWFFILTYRQKHAEPMQNWKFNLVQLFLLFWTMITITTLMAAIEDGLLGYPDMSIVGNGSSGEHLIWFQDRLTNALPETHLYSLPILAYRGFMLLWALWLAQAVLSWARWGWDAFSTGGVWRSPMFGKISLEKISPASYREKKKPTEQKSQDKKDI